MVRRVLEEELEYYIDKKLAGNPFAQKVIADKIPRLITVEAGKSMVGIKEATGRNDGKMIRLIQETVGGASGEPYCCGGIETLVAYAEKKTGLISPIPVTELAQDLWWKTPKKYRVKSIPLPGAAIVWADLYPDGSRKSTGHTELVLWADEKVIHCVGFNTSGTTKPGSEVNREGNGVFYTVRSYKSTASRKYLGCVKLF